MVENEGLQFYKDDSEVHLSDIDDGLGLTPEILIVDDEIYNVEALKVMLTHIGIDVERYCTVAMNGEQAVKEVKGAHIRGERFKLILMDCNMPFMDGYQATKLIREFLTEVRGEQPVITAVTDHHEQEYVDRCIEVGMNNVFTKPARLALLKALLTKIRII